MVDTLAKLIEHWKADRHSTYNTWFLWEERLKNFRSTRRRIRQVVRDIDAGTFGNAYRGMLCLNEEYGTLLSNDFSAIAGLCSMWGRDGMSPVKGQRRDGLKYMEGVPSKGSMGIDSRTTSIRDRSGERCDAY